ncbi:Ankyrin repeat family protein [Corchorus olitorius]|uniref:Ankyrin repeat family protein n=1 Tax=Corchorus olitorius TaxID=93759 RepID=A0A1R3JDR5_9ROSI|nr:Ankyrin repeat family protein [Corchorus olitorius]
MKSRFNLNKKIGRIVVITKLEKRGVIDWIASNHESKFVRCQISRFVRSRILNLETAPGAMTTEYDSESDQYDAEESLEEAIKSDNRDEFVPLMTMQFRGEFTYPHRVHTVTMFVRQICLYEAVNCAAAVLEGETEKQLDLNAFYPYKDMTMLHEACHSPELVELFLCYGARTDIKSKVTESNGIYGGMIPFTLSVRMLS